MKSKKLINQDKWHLKIFGRQIGTFTYQEWDHEQDFQRVYRVGNVQLLHIVNKKQLDYMSSPTAKHTWTLRNVTSATNEIIVHYGRVPRGKEETEREWPNV